MDVRLILTDKAYEKDALSARLFLGIFGLDWKQEVRAVDVSKKELYESAVSSSGKDRYSLSTKWVLSLAPERCVALVCDKSKSLQIGLHGQQGTLNNRYAVEVYADKRKGTDTLSGTAVTICHEIMHALAEYHNVQDTLHADLDAGKSLEECREMLLGRVLFSMGTRMFLLPETSRLMTMVEQYARTIGTPIALLEGYRSPYRQDELYKQRPKVTNAKAWQSMHQYRISFDYCFVDKPNYPKSGDQKWNRINSYARSIGLYSYGLEENFDDGHLQLTFGKTEKQIMSRDIDWRPYWNAPAGPRFDRDLEKGMSGEDVMRLQQYLNREGFTVAKTGAGSPGHETDYFGDLTRTALAAYQRWYAISPAEGYFGPKTRKHVNGKDAA